MIHLFVVLTITSSSVLLLCGKLAVSEPETHVAASALQRSCVRDHSEAWHPARECFSQCHLSTKTTNFIHKCHDSLGIPSGQWRYRCSHSVQKSRTSLGTKQNVVKSKICKQKSSNKLRTLCGFLCKSNWCYKIMMPDTYIQYIHVYTVCTDALKRTSGTSLFRNNESEHRV